MANFVVQKVKVLDIDSPFYKKTVDIVVQQGIIEQIGVNIALPKNITTVNTNNAFVSQAFVDLYCQQSSDLDLVNLSAVCTHQNKNIAQVKNIKLKQTTNYSCGNIHKFNNLSANFCNEIFALSNCGSSFEDSLVLLNIMKYASSVNLPLHIQPLEKTLSQGDAIDSNHNWQLGLNLINKDFEVIDIFRIATLSKQAGCKLHFNLISTKKGVDLLRQLKTEGLDFTADTAIANILLNTNDCKAYDTSYKFMPPLNNAETQNALIDGLLDHTITAISSNHTVPNILAKNNTFDNSYFNCPTLPYMLQLLIEVSKKHKLDLAEVCSWFSSRPAKLLKQDNKIDLHKKANLIIFDDKTQQKINSPSSPWHNHNLYGSVIKSTINAGL